MTNSTAPNSLSRRIYTNHLEEVDFLLTQRMALFCDREVDWPDIAESEDRLLAHLDGLVQGGAAADEIAAEWLASDDIDKVRAAVFALSHSQDTAALDKVWEAMASSSAELVGGYHQSLRYASNNAVVPGLSALAKNGAPHVRATAIETLGYRREASLELIKAGMTDSDPSVVKASAIAARRCLAKSCQPQLLAALNHEDRIVAAEAALALAVLGSAEGFRWLRRTCSTTPLEPPEVALALALCGDATDTDLLLRSSAVETAPGICALGILGNPAGVPALIRCLASDDEVLRFAAAEALQQLTGADLSETRTSREEFTDTDGEAADVAETTYDGVSTSADQWSEWWKNERNRFSVGGRYRLGQPWAVSTLVQEINNPKSKYTRRLQAYLEMLTSESTQVHFEPDWFVVRQNATVKSW